LTGPGDFGDLSTNYVIHAVGPNYWDFVDYRKGDALLKSAYHSSLQAAGEAELQEVAFALLSAGVYRGERTSREVLEVGIQAICEFVSEESEELSLRDIYMCGFSDTEANTLLEICNDLSLKPAAAESDEL
jgi:O-acetyl-ADP-ribose deacetylase (regulator of RNase III)